MRLLVAILLFLPGFAWATFTTNYVRVSSAGSANGSDWSNPLQWSSFTPTRPATGSTNIYYYDDGSYGGKTFSVAVNGTGRIWIKKATVDDHGTSTGWVSTMGDGTNIHSAGIIFTTGYWTLDGNRLTNLLTRTFTATNTAPQGIHIDVGNGGTGVDLQAAMTGTVIKDVHIKGPGFHSTTVETDGILMAHGGDPLMQDITIQGCFVERMDTLMKFDNNTNLIVEYSTFAFCSSADLVNVHPDTIYAYPCNGVTIRYNCFTEVDAESIFLDFGSALANNWYFYGNVMTKGVSGSSGNCIQLKQGFSWGNFYLYNNIFDGWDVLARGSSAAGKSFNMTNNIFWNGAGWSKQGDNQTVNSDYNGFNSTKPSGEGSHSTSNATDPFVSNSGMNYRLTSGKWPIDIGVNLGSPYDQDADGNTRGSDGTWDIGAFEFQSGADTTPPTVTSATVNTAGTSLTLALSETSSIGAGGNGGLTISMSGGAVTLTWSSGFVWTTSRTILSGETGTHSYTQPGNGIEDTAGNDLVTYSGATVTNNSTASGGGGVGINTVTTAGGVSTSGGVRLGL